MAAHTHTHGQHDGWGSRQNGWRAESACRRCPGKDPTIEYTPTHLTCRIILLLVGSLQIEAMQYVDGQLQSKRCWFCIIGLFASQHGVQLGTTCLRAFAEGASCLQCRTRNFYATRLSLWQRLLHRTLVLKTLFTSAGRGTMDGANRS